MISPSDSIVHAPFIGHRAYRTLPARDNLGAARMITLYHSPQTRSASIVWLLEELAVPYEIGQVDWRHPDGSGAQDPANPHPHGKVPALADDGEIVFETSAIAPYLADKYRASPMGPRRGDPTRGAAIPTAAPTSPGSPTARVSWNRP